MTQPIKQQQLSPITLTHIIYGLYALGVIVWFLPIIAVIIDYVKIDDLHGSWLESHLKWQIQTFWITAIFLVVGGVLTFVGIGFIILFILFIWYLYRIIKGWIRLSDGLPVKES